MRRRFIRIAGAIRVRANTIEGCARATRGGIFWLAGKWLLHRSTELVNKLPWFCDH